MSNVREANITNKLQALVALREALAAHEKEIAALREKAKIQAQLMASYRAEADRAVQAAKIERKRGKLRFLSGLFSGFGISRLLGLVL